MKKSVIQKWTVYFILFLLIASTIGYLSVPELVLNIVGIEGTKENSFLARTISAVLFAFAIPIFSVVRNKIGNDIKWAVILGLAIYMFLSSLIDFYGYKTGVVNFNSVPSIIFRVILGIILLITNQKNTVVNKV